MNANRSRVLAIFHGPKTTIHIGFSVKTFLRPLFRAYDYVTVKIDTVDVCRRFVRQTYSYYRRIGMYKRVRFPYRLRWSYEVFRYDFCRLLSVFRDRQNRLSFTSLQRFESILYSASLSPPPPR